MDNRRYYVLGVARGQMDGHQGTIGTSSGELGPYTREDLREALMQGVIVDTDQVRTGLGTMIGTVGSVLANEGSDAPSPSDTSVTSDSSDLHRGVRRSLAAIPMLVVLIAAGLVFYFQRSDHPISVGNPTPPPESYAGSVHAVAKPITPAQPNEPRASQVPTSSVLINAQTKNQTAGAKIIAAAVDGTLTLLANDAVIIGGSPRIERTMTDPPFIARWAGLKETVTWTAQFTKAGRHQVTFEYACPESSVDFQFRVTVGSRSLAERTKSTGSWNTYASVVVGFIHIDHPGVYSVSVEKLDKRNQAMMNLRQVSMTPK